MAVSVASHQGQVQQRLGLSNAKDAHNKHIVLVKLTDSSLEALTNYIKHANKVGNRNRLKVWLKNQLDKKILKFLYPITLFSRKKNIQQMNKKDFFVKTYGGQGRICLKSLLKINFREFFLQPYCIKHNKQKKNLF